MKHEEIKKLMKDIIENEFQHIAEYEEINFINADKEQNELSNLSEELFLKLREILPEEHSRLLFDFYSSVGNQYINMCRFYFKKGVVAGINNLNFIRKIDGISIETLL